MNPLMKYRGRTRRGGWVTMLALVLMVMITAMAMTLLAAVGQDVRMAGNYRDLTDARMAMESGMEFVGYHLANVKTEPTTTGQALLDAVAGALQSRLNGTANLNGSTVSYDGTTVTIPKITISSRYYVNCKITLVGTSSVLATAVGSDGRVSRTATLQFQPSTVPSSVFAKGVVTKSSLKMTGSSMLTGVNNPSEGGALLTGFNHDPDLYMSGSCSISGQVSMSDSNATTSLGSNITIGGIKGSDPAINTQIHSGVGAVDIPTVNSSVFLPFATTVIDHNTSTSGDKTFTNIYIKANSNLNFSGKVTIKGVCYIEQPNNIGFVGGSEITGVVVTQDAGVNAGSQNSLKFSGGCTINGPEFLPDTAEFHALRSLTGSAVLAPGFTVTFTGSSNAIGGAMAADSFDFSGGADAVVKGTIISYSDNPFLLIGFLMSGSSILQIDKKSAPTIPAGFLIQSPLVANSISYMEY